VHGRRSVSIAECRLDRGISSWLEMETKRYPIQHDLIRYSVDEVLLLEARSTSLVC
jgi:hypothetical protein